MGKRDPAQAAAGGVGSPGVGGSCGAVFGPEAPCLILKSTGLYCGACGFTRMVEELLQGNVGAAFRQNPYMFVLLPWQGLTWREERPAISGSGRPCGNGMGCRRY